jgi:membrane dipeptidase
MKLLGGSMAAVVILGVVIGVAVGVPLSKKNVNQQASIDELLSEVPLIDGHNDLPWQMFTRRQNKLETIDLYNWTEVHTDIPRLRTGRVGGQFWALYVGCGTQYKDAVRACLDQADVIRRFVDKYPEAFRWATSVQDIWTAFNASRVASLVGMEGGHCIDSSLATLRTFYDLGVRYMTLTHNCDTPWAENSGQDANATAVHVGLTEFGKTLVTEMNRLGMILDLSHVSHETMKDALALTQAPVMFSHSSVYNLCQHNRNVRDDVLLLTRNNSGVVMVNFYNNFVTCSNNATLSDVADHIQYIKNFIGADYVGIGGDYDGVSRTPAGLEDVSKYPALFQNLRDRGWTDEELKKLAGGNILRVFAKVEEVSAALKDQITPREEIIPRAELVDTSCRSITTTLE